MPKVMIVFNKLFVSVVFVLISIELFEQEATDAASRLEGKGTLQRVVGKLEAVEYEESIS